MSPPTAPTPTPALTPWRSLRHYRLQAPLTIAELAKAAGLSESGVQHLEAGRRRNPRPQTIVRLARALGVTVEQLRADLATSDPETQLDELRKQFAVLGERIEEVSSTLPEPRAAGRGAA